MADNPWLLGEVKINRDIPKELNALCEIARDRAGGNEASAWGTVVHWFTECIDNEIEWTDEPLVPDDVEKACKTLGKTLEELYDEAEDDLTAYEFATQRLTPVLNEQFTVNDEARCAGTLDRAYLDSVTGKTYIGDTKTGSVDFSGLKFAMQLAIYAHSEIYEWDPVEEEWVRKSLPNVDLDRAILTHLPKGKGECTLYWVNIAKGWEAVKFALKLKELRTQGKKWLRDVSLPDPVPVPALPDEGKGMKVAEIREFAKKWSIPLSGKTKKAEILEVVRAAEGLLLE